MIYLHILQRGFLLQHRALDNNAIQYICIYIYLHVLIIFFSQRCIILMINLTFKSTFLVTTQRALTICNTTIHRHQTYYIQVHLQCAGYASACTYTHIKNPHLKRSSKPRYYRYKKTDIRFTLHIKKKSKCTYVTYISIPENNEEMKNICKLHFKSW